MKKLFSVLALLGLIVSAPAFADVKVGEVAPDFTAKDSAGKEHKISALKGKIVVLEWTNPGCPFVKKHYGSKNMQNLQKYAKEKGAVWLSVNSSAKGKEGNVNAEEENKIIKEQGSNADGVILDEEGTIGKLYGAKTTPHMFVIDKENKIAYMGAIDDKSSVDAEEVKTAHNYVKEAIDALVAGKTPAKQVTTQYGCSVKY